MGCDCKLSDKSLIEKIKENPVKAGGIALVGGVGIYFLGKKMLGKK